MNHDLIVIKREMSRINSNLKLLRLLFALLEKTEKDILREEAEALASTSAEIYLLIDDSPIKPEVTDGEES